MTEASLSDDGYRCRREERRDTNRYPIQANAWFQWLEADGCLHESNARTSDISSHGLFVQCASSPGMGVAVEVVVRVPPGPAGGIRLQIRGKGRVARQVADQGFAASLAFRIERSEHLGDSPWECEAGSEYADPSDASGCFTPRREGWSDVTQA
jgi:hypothetical protein